MKIAAFALSAALLGLVSIAPVSAAPSAAGHATAQADGVTLVAKKVVRKKIYRNNGVVVKKKVVRRHNYRAGGRYKYAPKGWHRHSARPSYWQTRGCIMVGPIWWCP